MEKPHACIQDLLSNEKETSGMIKQRDSYQAPHHSLSISGPICSNQFLFIYLFSANYLLLYLFTCFLLLSKFVNDKYHHTPVFASMYFA